MATNRLKGIVEEAIRRLKRRRLAREAAKLDRKFEQKLADEGLTADLAVAAMKEKHAGVFFEWGPDSAKYHAHVDPPPNPPTIL